MTWKCSICAISRLTSLPGSGAACGLTQCVYALQASPVLEPHETISWNPIWATEALDDKVFDLLSCSWRQVVGSRVVLQQEFGPDNEVDNVRIESIRPVIEQNLVVVGVAEGLTQ